MYEKSHLKKVAMGEWTTSLPVSEILTVYMTACDDEKSFSLDKTVEITSHVRFCDSYVNIGYRR